MSHFSKLKTTLKDLTLLKRALTDLSISWEDSSQTLRGYKGQTSFANIVIKQNNNYDIGFVWNGFEYQLIADLQFWQQPWSVESFLDKVTQRYAYNSIIQATQDTGFQSIEEVVQENGTIKLTLQRWK
nr:photosystem I assembly protein Ycf35 [Proteomonas sp. NEIS-1375]